MSNMYPVIILLFKVIRHQRILIQSLWPLQCFITPILVYHLDQPYHLLHLVYHCVVVQLVIVNKIFISMGTIVKVKKQNLKNKWILVLLFFLFSFLCIWILLVFPKIVFLIVSKNSISFISNQFILVILIIHQSRFKLLPYTIAIEPVQVYVSKHQFVLLCSKFFLLWTYNSQLIVHLLKNPWYT